MLKVLQNLKGNLRVESRTKAEGNRSSYQTNCNEEAERQVLQVRTERSLEEGLPKTRYG